MQPTVKTSGVKPRVCHFSSVHDVSDTRVFYRECISLSNWYDVTLIGLGTASGLREGVTVIGLRRPSNRLTRILRTTRQAYRKALATRAQLYHFHDPELIPLAWLIKKRGQPVIFDIHENVAESFNDKDWLPFKPVFRLLYRVLEKLAARHFYFILAEKSYEAVYRRRYPRKPVRLIQNFAPCGFLDDYRRTTRPVEPLRIFYMGSLDHSYHLRPMLESIQALRERGVEARLILVGKIEPALQREMKRWDFLRAIAHQVEFCGQLELQQGYARSVDCACGYCFVSDTVNMNESVPRKLYEYLAIGMPVISSGFSPYRSIVEGNQLGICLDECTPGRIADAVMELVSDPAALNRLASRAVEIGNSRYNWRAQETVLHDLYDSILSEPSRSKR